MKKPNTSKARLDLPASQGIGYWVGEHFTVVLTDKTIIFLYLSLSFSIEAIPEILLGRDA